MENSNIAWTHNTQNFWLGCDKIAPECAHCYIGRTLRQQGREPWGQLYRTKTWNNPAKWQKQAEAQGTCYRVFTNSLSDFFHAEADAWREEAWDIVKDTPNLVWLILTKRPELVASRLPKDWGGGYPNVWLGTSVGCNRTLNKMDSLRKIPVHPQALRFVSCEPLLEDIADQVNLDGFGWVITGGESGGGQEYLWDKNKDWRKEFDTPGRRTMKIEWAQRLLEKSKAAGIPFFFKQITSFRSGVGEEALGQLYHEFPPPPHGKWADKPSVEEPVLISISAAGDAADPSTALVPAPTEEKNVSKTTGNSCGLASNEASDFEKFTVADREIYDDTDNWVDHWNDVILPKVYRMREFLSERGSMHVAGGLLPSWSKWRDRYIDFLKRRMKTSKSTLERQLFKFQLTQGGDDNCDGAASGLRRKSHVSSGNAKTDEELPEAKLLAEARAQFGRAAAAGDEQSAAIIAHTRPSTNRQ